MDADTFEAQMRIGEYFHGLRLPPGVWAVIRVDGRSFSRFTERFQKPFDPAFRDLMIAAARALLLDFGGWYAFVQSDEISLLLPRAAVPFQGQWEKLVSLSAAVASSAFALAANRSSILDANEYPHFDSRIWIGVNEEVVIDYFRWRMGDATRNALNGWAYWTLRQDGWSMAKATEYLHGQGMAAKNEVLFQHRVNFNDRPAWERRGLGLYWETYTKEGLDPRTGQSVSAGRRRIKVDLHLAMGEAYSSWLRQSLAAWAVPKT